MQTWLKAKYTARKTPKMVSKSNRGGNNGKARSKGLNHPIGLSGRTCGLLIKHFKPKEGKS